MKYIGKIILLFGIIFPFVINTAAAVEKGSTDINIKGIKSVLILGNSITRHAPAPKIGWSGDWGMAASAADKDFVHLLMAKFKALDPEVVVNFQNISQYERAYWNYNLSKLDSLKALHPDLVILRIGENVPAASLDKYDFGSYYKSLIDYFKNSNPKVSILCVSSFWKNDQVDVLIKTASDKAHCAYLKLSRLSEDTTNMASGQFENKGVAKHPSDKGMAAIADLIWSAVRAPIHQPSPAIVRGFMMRDNSTQQDYDDARAFGANMLRLQLHPGRYAAGKKEDLWKALPSYLDQIEEQIRRAKKAGLKVVVDLHEPPYVTVDYDQPDLWNRPDLTTVFCRTWKEIATRLLPYRDVIWGYDLYNEPLDRTQLPKTPYQWRPLALQILHTIREVDKKTWIIYETGPGSLVGGFKGLEPLPDSLVIYGAHFYYPQTFTHQGVFDIKGTDLPEAMKKINISYPGIIDGSQWDKISLNGILKDIDKFQDKWSVPVYMGEFSVIRWAPKDAATRWLQDVVDLFESRGWSWSYHAFREFQGWSLEHDEKLWMEGMPQPLPVHYDTDRAKIIKNAFKKNWINTDQQ